MREERLRNQAEVNETDETTELKLLIGKLAILRGEVLGRRDGARLSLLNGMMV